MENVNIFDHKRIRISRHGRREIFVDEICEREGFKRNQKDGLKRHSILKKYFTTSLLNSENLWEKNGRLYMFDGWDDEETRDCFKWTGIFLVDVTDLIN